MDLRDFEPARTDRRLSGETAQAPALRHRVFFALVIFQLGAMSLVWALLAPLLSFLLPRALAGRLGRAGVAFLYRCCWASAGRLGLMHVDSSALDVLRDEPGGLAEISRWRQPPVFAATNPAPEGRRILDRPCQGLLPFCELPVACATG